MLTICIRWPTLSFNPPSGFFSVGSKLEIARKLTAARVSIRQADFLALEDPNTLLTIQDFVVSIRQADFLALEALLVGRRIKRHHVSIRQADFLALEAANMCELLALTPRFQSAKRIF